MKKAIKALEKRCELLTELYNKLDKIFDNVEMTSENEFIHSDLVNIELELEELEEAVTILNMYIK
jgi:hypothetical protein